MESGWDPEVKKFFVRILNTISAFLLWLLIAVTAGFYFKLAIPGERHIAATIIYYILLLGSLGWLLRYFHRKWKD